jgi:hypothetical protein
MSTDMSKSLRLIIFLFFLLAFLISAPIVVLFTAGYRFDSTNGRIVHTAVLNISSQPRGASVSVDREETSSEKTPTVIDTILPGTHTISLQKAGYFPWETTLTFASSQARILGPIVLFLEGAPQRHESTEALVTTFNTTTNQFAYITQQPSWIEVWSVDQKLEQKKLFMRLPHIEASTYALDWSLNGTYLALTQQLEETTTVLIARASDGAAIQLPTLSTPIQSSWWDTQHESFFYLQTQTSITRVDIQASTFTTLAYPAQRVSTINGRDVAVLTSSNRVAVSYQDTETASIITYLPLGAYEFFPAPSGLISLYEPQKNRLTVLDASNREQPILFQEEVTHWKWNASGDTLVFTSGYDLKLYHRSAHEIQTITRLSTSLHQVDWFPLGNVVVYQTADSVVALNLDEGHALSSTTIAQAKNGPFFISVDGKQLFQLHQAEQLWEWWKKTLQE